MKAGAKFERNQETIQQATRQSSTIFARWGLTVLANRDGMGHKGEPVPFSMALSKQGWAQGLKSQELQRTR